MIRCHKSHLESRCKQRGYRLADVMPCVIEQHGDEWLIDPNHPAYPRNRGTWKPIDVGRVVENALQSVGITKDRVEKLTGTAGKPGGCGCAARKQWLTEAGNTVQYAARDAIDAAKRFYLGE
jgi:hypothetical protein